MTTLQEDANVIRPLYDRPPVSETLLGVQFKPLRGFGALHYGLYWHNCLSELGWLPEQDAPLFPRYAESFENSQLRPNQSKPEEQIVGVRISLKNEAGDRLLQFQPDKLYYSWQRTDSVENQRPHYAELKKEFGTLFRTLTDFATENELGPIQPDLWEVKYLNMVPPGSLWSEPHDWHQVLPSLFQPTVSPVDGLRFATFEGEWYYEIQPQLGRVRIRVAKMLLNQKPPPMLYIRLLARGEIGEKGLPDWPAGFDAGHAACNKLFNAVTSPKSQNEWGIHHDS